jgi:dihydroxyacetone kinase DhaKLM complex PTS-EIIA-like component DhaM
MKKNMTDRIINVSVPLLEGDVVALMKATGQTSKKEALAVAVASFLEKRGKQEKK